MVSDSAFDAIKIDISVQTNPKITFADQVADNSICPSQVIPERVSRTVAERTKYQKNIIRNYYDNRESISLQRAQEIVTELYLSEGKKRQKHWQSLANHLAKLNVKPDQIDHLVQQDDPQLAAKLITKLGQD